MIQAEHSTILLPMSHSDSSGHRPKSVAGQRHVQQSLRLAALLCILLSSTACNEYWRSRGQPPSVAQLMQRSQAHLSEQVKVRAEARPELARIAQNIEKSMLAMFSDGTLKKEAVQEQLASVQKDFLSLEGKVSIGSRAAFGELSAQLRGFVGQAAKGGEVDYAALGLFTSRVIRFFGNEMMVPGPEFG